MPSPQWRPNLRPSAVFLVALSLSIGWGIRGNFGHEYGAMIPGTLAGIAVCLLSGRADWRSRAPHFAFFGAAGWAFGGSMSYMKVVNYTQSGHLPSIVYGFGGLFLGGFLWSALGATGTAYAAVEDSNRIARLYRPLCWVLVVWTAYYFLWEPVMNTEPVSRLIGGRVTGAERGLFREMRQNDPFYWLDTDWVQAFLALVAVCVFDLWNRRSRDILYLPVLMACGAGIGWLAHRILEKSGALLIALPVLVRVQGDLTVLNPETGLPFDPGNMVTNWPQIFFTYSDHLGWALGLAIGAAIYFRVYGQWRCGASLLLYMILGWFTVFLIGPVLLGLRMTPPRNDNWAGILGVFLGMSLYAVRNNLIPVAYASIVGGTIGGFGIALTQCLKLLLIAPGNPNRLADLPPDVRAPLVQAWAHWQSANWHSIVIEQGVGLIYGAGIAVAIGLLATRVQRQQDVEEGGRWTKYFATACILIAVVYLNMVKNVTEFTKLRGPHNDFRCVPEIMKAPLFESLQLSTRAWFSLGFGLYALCMISLLAVHARRRRLSLVPTTSLGQGQLLYVVFLWIAIVFNFEKALVGFHEQRLATEGILFVNAVLATFLIAVLPREDDRDCAPTSSAIESKSVLTKASVLCLATLVFCMIVFSAAIHLVYGGKAAGAGGQGGHRFGPAAEWRLYPVLRDKEHR